MRTKIVRKPWGQEEWIAHNELYVLKIITLKKGYRTSLQYHQRKHETNYVDSGKILGWLENEEGEMQKIEMGPGSAFVVVPGRIHRVEALKDSRLIEASTPQVDDVIRVEDDFRRGDGRISAEHEEE